MKSQSGTRKRPGKVGQTLTVARVRKLGLDHGSITAAAAHVGRRWDLPSVLESHPELFSAWRRGQLLRNLWRLASVGATRHEAAHDLHIALEDFDALVSKDLEAVEIWNSGKLETAIKLKESLLANVMEGKAQAIKQLENVLRSEIAQAQLNPQRIPEPLICEIFAVSRQTLNLWHREKGCPRNAGETTYDLPAMIRWFESFIRAKCTGGAIPETNPLQAVKAERLELELRARKGELLDAESVKAGILVRERALLAILEHKPDELAHALAGKTSQQIKPVIEQFCKDLRAEWVRAIDRGIGGDL